MAWQVRSEEATPGVASVDQAPQQRAQAGRLAVFNALRYRNYRLYWTGLLLSVMAQTMEWVALAWLVLELTNSPASLGLTGLAQALPRMALVFVGGVLADRMDRRLLIVAAQGLGAALYLVLATLVVLGLVQVWHVMAFAVGLGCIRAFDTPSRQAILPHMVPRGELPTALALGNLAWDLPRPVGPAAAGVLIALIGVGQTFYVAGSALVLATILFAMLQAPKPPPQGAEAGMLRSILAGLAFIRRNQIFYALMGLTFFNSVFGMSVQFLVPVFARDVLQVGSEGYGFLQTATGVGSAAGSLLAASLVRRAATGRRILVGAAAFGLLLVGFAFSTSYPLSLALVFCAGAANIVYMVAIATALQLRLPDEYRARVMGVYSLTWSLMPLGGTISGTIAEFYGAPVALAIGGSLVAGMALLVAVALPRVRDLE